MSHLALRPLLGAALGWGRGRAWQGAVGEERAEQEVEEVLPLPAQGRTGEAGGQQEQVWGQQVRQVQQVQV